MSDEKKPSSEEMVRMLMKLNPHLRGEGQSTKDVVAVLDAAKAGKPPPDTTKAVAAPRASGPNLNVELVELRRAHERSVMEHDKHLASLRTGAQKLEREQKAIAAQACQQLIDALLKLDPNLTQRKNQIVLDKEKEFLAAIGFTANKLIAAERKE